MNALPELLQDIDLPALAKKLLALESTDACFVVVILGVITFLGSRMAASTPMLLTWGVRLGLVAFLGNIGHDYIHHGGIEKEKWASTLIRSIVAAELVMAPLWTIVPIFAFFYRRLRLGLGTFLIYCIYAGATAEQLNQETLQTIAIRGGLAMVLVLIVAWILQPVTDFVVLHLFPKKPTSTPVAAPPVAPPTPVPAAPATQLAVASPTLMRDAQLQVEAQRRSRARLRAELCYTMHENALGSRFPRYLFEDFMKRYMGDDVSVDHVEEHLRELEATIQQHAAAATVQTPAETLTVTDLTRWLLEEQARIQTLQMDGEQRKTQLAGITRRYTELVEKMIEEEKK